MDTRSDLEALMHRRVSDREWTYLEDYGFVGEVESDAESVSYLRDKLREVSEVAESGRRPATKPVGESRTLEFSGATASASRYDLARSMVIAALAREDADVQAFRNEILDDRLITWDEVPAWIEARASESPQIVEVTVAVDKPPAVATHWTPDETPLRVRRVGAEMLLYSRKTEDGAVRATIAVHFGVLQRLHRLALDLSTFYGWREEDTVVFVLADVVPWVAPILVTTTTDPIYFGRPCEWTRRIKLDIDPGVPASEVASVYQEARARRGYDQRRRLSNKHSDMAALRSEMPRARWSTVREEWNRRNPKEAYSAQQESNFRRDVPRAQAQLLYPDRFHNGRMSRVPWNFGGGPVMLRRRPPRCSRPV